MWNGTSEFSKTVIKFVGWGDCESFKSTYDGIRISFLGDGETRVGSYGQSNLGVVDGQGFLRKKMGDYVYSPTLAINGGRFLRHNPRGGTTLRAVNANTLLHEIGHGVGLLHEHVRDSSCSNYGEQSYDSYMARYSEEQKKELYIETPKADPNSIMNYCYVLGSSDKSRFAGLSPGDVEIINGLYSDVEEDDGIDWPFSLD